MQENIELKAGQSAQTIAATMLGAMLKEADDADKAKLNIRGGVEVADVKEGQFKECGIRNGFIILNINGVQITHVQDVEKVFQDIMKTGTADEVMFIKGLYPNGKAGYYAVRLTE